MKILVTGAPGWLANRFLEILVQGGDLPGAFNACEIRCLILPGVNTAFLETLSRSKKIDFVSGDVTQPHTLPPAVQDVDVVFHIAGIIHPRRIAELYAVNTQGTKNILAASQRAGVKRLVFVSSNSAAGTNASREQLLQETDTPRPYFNYGVSKLLAEEAVLAAHASGGMETVILRPCWYYGPNQPERQTTFFRMIQKGNPIIFGDGNNLRSMSYVDNTCQALLRAAESAKAAGQIYWIADERPYTCNEIYQTVAELLEVKNYHPRHLPEAVSTACYWTDSALQKSGLYIKEIHVAGEMNKTIACSIAKAQNDFGYKPAIALREGMKRSIAWCRAHGIAI